MEHFVARAADTSHIEQVIFDVHHRPDPSPPSPAVRPATASVIVSAYKTQQHRLEHRGRTFHFVSYEAQVANEKHKQVAMPPTWYVMLGGKRWAVTEQAGAMEPADLDRIFGAWLDDNVFSAVPAA